MFEEIKESDQTASSEKKGAEMFGDAGSNNLLAAFLEQQQRQQQQMNEVIKALVEGQSASSERNAESLGAIVRELSHSIGTGDAVKNPVFQGEGPNKRLDKPVVFYMKGLGGVVVDGIINGMPFDAPKGAEIKFKPYGSRKKGISGRGKSMKAEDIVHFSRYVARTSWEVEFLRLNQWYGVRYWEGDVDYQSDEAVKFIDRIMRIEQDVRSLTKSQIWDEGMEHVKNDPDFEGKSFDMSDQNLNLMRSAVIKGRLLKEIESAKGSRLRESVHHEALLSLHGYANDPEKTRKKVSVPAKTFG